MNYPKIAHHARTAFAFLLLGSVLLSVPGFAGAQDKTIVDLSDRIERMERDIQTLNYQLSKVPLTGEDTGTSVGSSSPATTASPSASPNENLPEGAVERLLVRITRMEEELRTATDGMERVDHRISQIESRLETLIGDVDFRLARLEGGTSEAANRVNAAPGPAAVRPQGSGGSVTPITGYNSMNSSTARDNKGILGTMPKNEMDAAMGRVEGTNAGEGGETPPGGEGETAVASAPVPDLPKYLPEGSVDDQYKHAFNLLRRASYAEAEQAWKEFISLHESEKLTENARYWLGETYYVQKRFIDSAQAFLASYKAAPTGAKAMDSLFKLGKSMSSMDKKPEACAAYAKLRKEFSDIPANISKSLDREISSLGCS